MWKKGELVWARLNTLDSWVPGRILDPSEQFGILVSFFDLMEPRYVPEPCIRSFVRNFKTLVADSWRFRHLVDRALKTHFWNISFGLWCSCQSPVDSPYLYRGYSLPCSPLSSGSALRFVRDSAVSKRVPLRRLAKNNSSTAQILSFRRYTVDSKRSESVYEQVKESAKLMDCAEEPDWYIDPSSKMDCIDDMDYMFPETEDADVDDSSDWSLRDSFPKDIHCCSVDGVVQSWNTRSPVISSGSGVMKACGTMARVSNQEGVETDVQVEEEHMSAVEELNVEEENEMDVEDENGHSETSDKEDETSEGEEEVEIDSRNSTLVAEENLNCGVGEDGEAEDLQDTIDEDAGVETSDGECGDDEEEEKAVDSGGDREDV